MEFQNVHVDQLSAVRSEIHFTYHLTVSNFLPYFYDLIFRTNQLFQDLVTTYTGFRPGAGTKSRIGITIYGEEYDTGVRALTTDDELVPYIFALYFICLLTFTSTYSICAYLCQGLFDSSCVADCTRYNVVLGYWCKLSLSLSRYLCW